MSKVAIGFWLNVAWAMAILTVLASGLVIYQWGAVEVRVSEYHSGTKEVIDWGVVAWCAVSSIYALLFAALFSAIYRLVPADPPYVPAADGWHDDEAEEEKPATSPGPT